ncbi:hypothetical protein KYY02_19630 [Streptomyces pimonensis]|uniref:Uncharacterized protein n=1 Tax=Streptomyces pimonensis TaxID=2860288 RepID=A0ABV4J5Z3_9ACTN
MQFEYRIHVPVIADLNDSWNHPESQGRIEWNGTAHSLARHLLAKWHQNVMGEAAGLPAAIEVFGEQPGRFAKLDDPSPVSESVEVLEAAIEAKQVADVAVDIAAAELVAAMRDAATFGGESKNSVAKRVNGLMSRPTALKHLRT